ncbi:hypothetical protein EOD39_3845 [Acipenser ruthenus]|uniref:Uncharacterized protein n=1 Tax=Acipenser ruthenus TaxID=7906 RepID=A0A444UL55_ACIRT|nr:hypothetical protein EOD39_3845 [Acipenser ruthenus]
MSRSLTTSTPDGKMNVHARRPSAAAASASQDPDQPSATETTERGHLTGISGCIHQGRQCVEIFADIKGFLQQQALPSPARQAFSSQWRMKLLSTICPQPLLQLCPQQPSYVTPYNSN